jgi:hypothetical protein
VQKCWFIYLLLAPRIPLLVATFDLRTSVWERGRVVEMREKKDEGEEIRESASEHVTDRASEMRT